MIYHIILLVLLTLLLAALSTLTHLSRRNLTPSTDPTRLFHRFYNVTLYLYLASISIYLLVTALSLVEYHLYYRRLDAAVAHISSIAQVLTVFALCTLLQTIARLAIGARIASTNGDYVSTKFVKTINILTSITAAAWGMWWVNRQVVVSRWWAYEEYYRSGYAVANLVFSILGLVGFATLLIAVVTTVVYPVLQKV